MKVLSKQDLIDIIHGCTILGTGGGGELKDGLEIINKDLELGYEFKLVQLEDIPNDALVGSPYNAGSISPLSEENIKKFEKYEENKDYNLTSFKALEKYLGKKFYGAITTELGGSNSAVAFSVAARLGIPIVDGDPAGRSVPELQQSTFEFNDVNIYPLSVSSKFGDTIIIEEVEDGNRAEDIVRAMAVVSQNTVGVTDHPVSGEKLKTSVIPGAISYALKIGRALRIAKENKSDIGAEVARAGNGYILFRGKVSNFDWEDRDGFTFGNIYIDGNNDYEGDKYKIWFKNENLITWKNDKPHVTAPDLVCILSGKTGEPITNPYHEIGNEVVVIGLPCAKEWREDIALKELEPRHFDFDIDYIPIEEIMES